MQNSDCVVGFCIKVGSSEPSFTNRNVLFPLLITLLLDFIFYTVLLMSTTLIQFQNNIFISKSNNVLKLNVVLMETTTMETNYYYVVTMETKDNCNIAQVRPIQITV